MNVHRHDFAGSAVHSDEFQCCKKLIIFPSGTSELRVERLCDIFTLFRGHSGAKLVSNEAAD